ncbi:RES domain-containing protein [Microbacterium sp. KSW2-29]|uniref:RES domain-containing protein n=1 Tax=Microbacterium phycohabitans TaxID=3075993 RepID=A0ABU3SQ30_9MICO|nr:RES domain-containing protein [Microbacterium sp. KSW2-29]MDU0346467.1 RES domain-containing protein [Microbacterium sp. KSW2-29]
MELPRVTATTDAMCVAHISDAHLLRRIAPFAEEGSCALCPPDGLRFGGPVVNLQHVAELVDWAATQYYNHEGQFFDGEQLLEPMTTEEVVANLLDGCVAGDVVDDLGRRVAALIYEELDWFEPYDMDYEAGVEFEWDDFEQSVKHESRLLTPPSNDRAETAPERNWTFVRSLLVFAEKHVGLTQHLQPGTKLYRARIERDSRKLERDARESPAVELGPAPADRASAGRMNAQGVPMFYAAFDAETACAEVATHSPYDEPVAGAFVLQQRLRVLDLTSSLTIRSVFDDSPPREGDDRLASLAYYVQRITQPVILDGNHPVDYAPTQVLTDAFRYWARPRLDGIVYPSRVNKSGKNVVLFFGDPRWFEQVDKPASRMDRYKRGTERGSEDALFIIDPNTVHRYRVDRSIMVKTARVWGVKTDGAEDTSLFDTGG